MKHLKQESPIYRPAVGILLANWKHEIFIGQRLDTPADCWQMPQGGIDEGESPEQAVMRELLEELGTTKVAMIAATAQWHYYDFPEHLRYKCWGGRYRGQQQRWFALRFLGEDHDINIHTPHPEFHAWRWARVEEVPQLVIDFKRQVYRDVLMELYPKILASSSEAS
jgi:putative (di)nucleoside polyphosphate hydrolase